MRTLEAQKVLPVFVFVLMVAAAVAAIDVVLVRVAARHRAETGHRLFENGLRARAQGHTETALELLRSAYNRAPGNAAYHLAFAQALVDAGRTREGHAALSELLDRHPADGAANAEMARALAKQGDWQRAAWYYHRAIYGEWPSGVDLRALRFELAELLARHGEREQLVSEVVLLSTEPAAGAEAKRLGGLQLAAGEWGRAELLFRSLLRKDAADPELLTGLAKAQMGQGRYLAAERSLRRAVAAGATNAGVEPDDQRPRCTGKASTRSCTRRGHRRTPADLRARQTGRCSRSAPDEEPRTQPRLPARC